MIVLLHEKKIVFEDWHEIGERFCLKLLFMVFERNDNVFLAEFRSWQLVSMENSHVCGTYYSALVCVNTSVLSVQSLSLFDGMVILHDRREIRRRTIGLTCSSRHGGVLSHILRR